MHARPSCWGMSRIVGWIGRFEGGDKIGSGHEGTEGLGGRSVKGGRDFLCYV